VLDGSREGEGGKRPLIDTTRASGWSVAEIRGRGRGVKCGGEVGSGSCSAAQDVSTLRLPSLADSATVDHTDFTVTYHTSTNSDAFIGQPHVVT